MKQQHHHHHHSVLLTVGCFILLFVMIIAVVQSSFQSEQQLFQSLDTKVSKSVKQFFGEKYTQDSSIQRSSPSHLVIKKQLDNEQVLEEKVVKQVYPKPDSKRTKLWIFLNEKEGTNLLNNNNNNIRSTNKLIVTNDLIKNQHAINRRLNRGSFSESERVVTPFKASHKYQQKQQKTIVNEKDLPISESIINRILECNLDDAQLTIHHRIKWINAVSISISTQASSNVASSVLGCITEIPQVDRVELVNRFYKPKYDNEVEELNKAALEIERENILAEGEMAPRRHLLTFDEQDRMFYNNTYHASNQINVPAAHENGYNGTGVIVLILDSGYLKNHTAFKNLTFLDEYDFVNNQTDTQGPIGDPQNTHGTATLSTIAGYVPGVMVGPAYQAHFLLAKTEDTSAEYVEEEDNWIAAVQWGEERGADMLTSSLGYTDWYKYYQLDSQHAPITMAADAAAERGMTVVVSAGNSGERGIGAPADGKNVIAVAAIDDHGKTATFSSRGPSADGRVKPDVSALGVSNFVASAQDPRYYTRMSGTSFACPMIGGAVALILQAHPDWTPELVYEAITKTASTPNTPDSQQGFGIVNTWEAINYKPTISTNENCNSVGCSGHGGCCNGKCACASDRYGRFCQFKKLSCGSECLFRGGKCLIDQYQFSFVCGNIDGPTHKNETNTCSLCDSQFDVCGVCGGNGQSCVGCDNVPFSGKVVDVCGKCGGNGSCKSVVPEPSNSDNNGSRLKILVGSVVGGVGFILIVGAIVIIVRKNRDKNTPFLGFPGRGYEPLREGEDDF